MRLGYAQVSNETVSSASLETHQRFTIGVSSVTARRSSVVVSGLARFWGQILENIMATARRCENMVGVNMVLA